MNKYIVTTDAYNEEVEIVYADRMNVNDSNTLSFYRGGDDFDYGEIFMSYNAKSWDKAELAVEDEANPE